MNFKDEEGFFIFRGSHQLVYRPPKRWSVDPLKWTQFRVRNHYISKIRTAMNWVSWLAGSWKRVPAQIAWGPASITRTLDTRIL